MLFGHHFWSTTFLNSTLYGGTQIARRKGAVLDQQWYEDLQLFTAIALSDTMCDCPDLLYLFSETDDNRASVMEVARELYRRASRVHGNNTAIPDNFTNPGYSGYAEWYKALHKHFVPVFVSVFPIKVPGNLNTMSEAQAMVRYAGEHGMMIVGIVAPAFHMPRAFLSAISVAVRECLDIKVYALPGATPDWWYDPVVHSQGQLRNTRAELFRGGERERIAKYQQEGDYYLGGDLVSFQLAFEYLRARDKRSPSI